MNTRANGLFLVRSLRSKNDKMRPFKWGQITGLCVPLSDSSKKIYIYICFSTSCLSLSLSLFPLSRYTIDTEGRRSGKQRITGLCGRWSTSLHLPSSELTEVDFLRGGPMFSMLVRSRLALWAGAQGHGYSEATQGHAQLFPILSKFLQKPSQIRAKIDQRSREVCRIVWCVSFVRRSLGRSLYNSVEPPNCRQRKCSEDACQKIGTSKGFGLSPEAECLENSQGYPSRNARSGRSQESCCKEASTTSTMSPITNDIQSQTHLCFLALDPLGNALHMGFICQSRFIGMAYTMFLVNRVFVPCQKGAGLTKAAKMTNLHPRTPETKWRVAQAKAWFRESRACSSLS